MGVLALNEVKYAYKSKHHTVKALDGVSFEFLPGKFYAVMGRSGSGKTTLLSVMAGLDVPDEGRVDFSGTDVKTTDRDRYRLEHVSVIYQGLNLFPLLSAIENVAFPLEYRGVRKAEAFRTAEENLRSVGIESDKFRRLPSTLSGGEQQRVAIARALAAKAEIILADEPTGNLDSENSLNIVQLLRDLAAAHNVCVVVVTHDPEVAERADVVLKISDGRLEKESSQNSDQYSILSDTQQS